MCTVYEGFNVGVSEVMLENRRMGGVSPNVGIVWACGCYHGADACTVQAEVIRALFSISDVRMQMGSGQTDIR